MLTVHHLGISQSDRIVWLCEELEIPYKLVRHARDPVTNGAPASLKAIHPGGTAPIITDGEVVLAESGEIIEYVAARHGGGRLVVQADDPAFAEYLFWFHFANGSLMPTMSGEGLFRMMGQAPENGLARAYRVRSDASFAMIETRLGTAAYFAGSAFTAADIMMLFPLTLMRRFAPRALGPYPNLGRYLKRIGARPGYQRAMKKADPENKPDPDLMPDVA
jgi:glutathione S-transferase